MSERNNAVQDVEGGIELHSIDWVPDAERHGTVWTQVPFRFLYNFQPITVGLGILGPTIFGLSIAQTAAAGLYFIFTRSLDSEAEAAAIDASERTLAQLDLVA